MKTEPRVAVTRPLRVKEFAERADLSLNAVYTMVRRGEIQAVRFGRSIRIPRQVGERLLGATKV